MFRKIIFISGMFSILLFAGCSHYLLPKLLPLYQYYDVSVINKLDDEFINGKLLIVPENAIPIRDFYLTRGMINSPTVNDFRQKHIEFAELLAGLFSVSETFKGGIQIADRRTIKELAGISEREDRISFIKEKYDVDYIMAVSLYEFQAKNIFIEGTFTQKKEFRITLTFYFELANCNDRKTYVSGKIIHKHSKTKIATINEIRTAEDATDFSKNTRINTLIDFWKTFLENISSDHYKNDYYPILENIKDRDYRIEYEKTKSKVFKRGKHYNFSSLKDPEEYYKVKYKGEM